MPIADMTKLKVPCSCRRFLIALLIDRRPIQQQSSLNRKSTMPHAECILCHPEGIRLHSPLRCLGLFGLIRSCKDQIYTMIAQRRKMAQDQYSLAVCASRGLLRHVLKPLRCCYRRKRLLWRAKPLRSSCMPLANPQVYPFYIFFSDYRAVHLCVNKLIDARPLM